MRKIIFYCDGSQALEQVASRDYGVSILETLKTWPDTALTLTDPALNKAVGLDGLHGSLPNSTILYLYDGFLVWPWTCHMTCLVVTGLLPELAYHCQTCSNCFTVALVGEIIAPCLPYCHPQPCTAAGPCWFLVLRCCKFLNHEQHVS